MRNIFPFFDPLGEIESSRVQDAGFFGFFHEIFVPGEYRDVSAAHPVRQGKSTAKLRPIEIALDVDEYVCKKTR
jgi:hypothetical protein